MPHESYQALIVLPIRRTSWRRGSRSFPITLLYAFTGELSMRSITKWWRFCMTTHAQVVFSILFDSKSNSMLPSPMMLFPIMQRSQIHPIHSIPFNDNQHQIHCGFEEMQLKRNEKECTENILIRRKVALSWIMLSNQKINTNEMDNQMPQLIIFTEFIRNIIK
jgi:hypothetical protein